MIHLLPTNREIVARWKCVSRPSPVGACSSIRKHTNLDKILLWDQKNQYMLAPPPQPGNSLSSLQGTPSPRMGSQKAVNVSTEKTEDNMFEHFCKPNPPEPASREKIPPSRTALRYPPSGSSTRTEKTGGPCAWLSGGPERFGFDKAVRADFQPWGPSGRGCRGCGGIDAAPFRTEKPALVFFPASTADHPYPFAPPSAQAVTRFAAEMGGMDAEGSIV